MRERCRALAAAWALAAASCTRSLSVPAQPDAARAQPGEVAAVETVGGLPRWALRGLVAWQGLADAFPIGSGVSLYRVVYWTTAPDGRRVRASGLVALPRTDAPLRGAVSFQHGTATSRDAAPSAPDVSNGVLASALFAGSGYLLAAPDYIGFGTSDEPHPYYHAASTASAVVDLLAASGAVAAAAGFAWPDALFLAGFSQGGHATLAAQRALESGADGCSPVRAAASIAGPVDLAGVEFPAALEGRSRFASLYIAWIASSYARAYGMPLDSVIREPYASLLDTLFDGRHDGDEVVAALPPAPRALLAPAFLADYDAGLPTWFTARLAENGLLDWTPRAPVRLYYGEADADVAPRDAQLAAAAFAARGADARAVSLGPVDHEGSVLPAARAIRAWFDALASGPAQSSSCARRATSPGAAAATSRVYALAAPWRYTSSPPE